MARQPKEDMDYNAFIRKLVVPPDTVVPTRLAYEDIVATPLTREHLRADVDGINGSLETIQRTRGGGWPTKHVTDAEDFADLVWHELEFREEYSFSYVVHDANGHYLGCCYLYPMGRRTELTDALLPYDVDVSWWVTAQAYAAGYYTKLYAALRHWLATELPFAKPYYSNAEIPADGVSAVRLPLGLEWVVEPTSWSVNADSIDVVAAESTDIFIDPAGSKVVLNAARALVVPPPGPWQLSARVTVDFQARYDAGCLVLWSDERHFAKLCLERSPQGEAMVVTVITRESSDDANGWTVDGDTVWLRISNVADGAYAFHASPDGRQWSFARQFALSGSGPMQCGIAVQAPAGPGCAVTFTNLALTATHLTNLRDGS